MSCVSLPTVYPTAYLAPASTIARIVLLASYSTASPDIAKLRVVLQANLVLPEYAVCAIHFVILVLQLGITIA